MCEFFLLIPDLRFQYFPLTDTFHTGTFLFPRKLISPFTLHTRLHDPFVCVGIPPPTIELIAKWMFGLLLRLNGFHAVCILHLTALGGKFCNVNDTSTDLLISPICCI